MRKISQNAKAIHNMVTRSRRAPYVTQGQIATLEQSHKSSVRGTSRNLGMARGELPLLKKWN